MPVSESGPESESRFLALVTPGQLRFEALPSHSLLKSAQLAGVALPASCRNGTCRTCICRLASGRVRYEIAWPGLTAEEKQEGLILPCVAYPESNVVIEAPGARSLVRECNLPSAATAFPTSNRV